MTRPKTPESTRAHVERMQIRAKVIKALRAFFEQEGFVEVDTPVALHAPAPEPHIEALATHVQTLDGASLRYLQTSPELGMKQLLTRGFDKIFQVAPVFRDGDDGPRHCPEFRLLEWYRLGGTWLDMVQDTQALVRHCAQQALGSSPIKLNGQTVDLNQPWRHISMEEAFLEHAGFSILSLLQPTALREALTKMGIRWTEDDSWDDLFHRVFLERVEPKLLEDPRPLILHSYPAPLASLARKSSTFETVRL